MNLKWVKIFCGVRQLSISALTLAWVMVLLPVTTHAHSQHKGSNTDRQEIEASSLPKEAKETLRLIMRGGPFPFPRDGVVFGNFEKRLPKKQRGFYHEYTVITPGVRSRGARRIVCGQPAPCYYSDDHYQTFKLIRE